jgi:sec-independent protein translocase protein TatA
VSCSGPISLTNEPDKRFALLVFGPKKLPELGKGLGEGIRGFKSAIREEKQPAATQGPVEEKN